MTLGRFLLLGCRTFISMNIVNDPLPPSGYLPESHRSPYTTSLKLTGPEGPVRFSPPALRNNPFVHSTATNPGKLTTSAKSSIG